MIVTIIKIYLDRYYVWSYALGLAETIGPFYSSRPSTYCQI